MQKIRYDIIFVALILLLTLLGLVTLYSASFLFASNQPLRFRSGWTPITSNLIVCGIMLILFPTLALMKLDWLKNGAAIIAIVIAAIILNSIPIILSYARSSEGSHVRRWILINVGSHAFSFQPSEIIKVVLPLYLAYILDKNSEKLNSFAYGFLPPVILTVIFGALVLCQSNFSETVLILIISTLICFAAGVRLLWFSCSLALIPVFYVLITSDRDGRWYKRFMGFFSKEIDPSGRDYQILSSMEAVQSGGFWGKGIGQGTLKTRMPEVHGDFVLASYAEETGLLGILIYLILIGFFVYFGYSTAWKSRDKFRQVLAFGLTTAIAVQTLTNIAVVVKLIPTTGIPLPFVSSGGSSLLITLIASALLVNIARWNILSGETGGHGAR